MTFQLSHYMSPNFGLILMLESEVHEARWRAFKTEYKFTNASLAALIKEAGDNFLRSNFVKGGKNRAPPEHLTGAFSNFIKEEKIVTFEALEPVTLEPLKIQGWPSCEARMAIKIKAGNRFPFSIMDFRNNPGGSIEGAMSCPFYEPFFTKFVDYGSPRFREVDIWLWIVKDKKSKHVYEIEGKLQPEYAVLKSHHLVAPTEGAYSTTKDKKIKILNLCLYFVYKAELLKVPNHPIARMNKLFQVPKGLGTSMTLYNKAKYANYPADKLRMEFYLQIMETATTKGDCIFNVFGVPNPYMQPW